MMEEQERRAADYMVSIDGDESQTYICSDDFFLKLFS